MNESKTRIIFNKLAEFLLLAALAFLPTLTVYVDVIVIGHGLSDRSVTEYTQEMLIFLSAILFWYGAWRNPQSRGFLLLVAGFFTCMFIREYDELLNSISHGFWVYPAMLTAIATILGAIACRDTVLTPMADFAETKSGHNIFFGLLVILVFSRFFGSGSLLWMDIMGEDYEHLYKSTIQEGLELFGYIFIFYGSCLSMRRRSHEDLQT